MIAAVVMGTVIAAVVVTVVLVGTVADITVKLLPIDVLDDLIEF